MKIRKVEIKWNERTSNCWYIHLEAWLADERLLATTLKGCKMVFWSEMGGGGAVVVGGFAKGSDWVRWWLIGPDEVTPPATDKQTITNDEHIHSFLNL